MLVEVNKKPTSLVTAQAVLHIPGSIQLCGTLRKTSVETLPILPPFWDATTVPLKVNPVGVGNW
jgi:hypothetical protein